MITILPILHTLTWSIFMYESDEQSFIYMSDSKSDLSITILTADNLSDSRFNLCSSDTDIITADWSYHLLTGTCMWQRYLLQI